MVAQPLPTQASIDEQTWRLLWAHAASRIVATCALSPVYAPVSIGVGCGLRHRTDTRRALLLHPAGRDRDVGDLALTVLGSGTHVIPRCGRDFALYLEEVADIVETTAANYFAS